MWIGTNIGLYRYNGKIWQQWNSNNNLPGNYITNIIPDKKAGLWLSIAEKGICFFDTKKMKAVEMPFSQNAVLLNSQEITGVLIQQAQQIKTVWHQNEKLFVQNAQTTTTNDYYLNGNKNFIKNTAKLSNLQLPNQVVQYASGNYFGNQQNVFFINNEECKQVNILPIFKQNLHQVFITQTDEFCFIANKGEGFVQLDTFGNQTFFDTKSGLNNVDIQHIYIAKDGAIYISTLGGGINILKSTDRVTFPITNGPIIDINGNSNKYFALDKSTIYTFSDNNEPIEKLKLPYTPTCIFYYQYTSICRCTIGNVHIQYK